MTDKRTREGFLEKLGVYNPRTEEQRQAEHERKMLEGTEKQKLLEARTKRELETSKARLKRAETNRVLAEQEAASRKLIAVQHAKELKAKLLTARTKVQLFRADVGLLGEKIRPPVEVTETAKIVGHEAVQSAKTAISGAKTVISIARSPKWNQARQMLYSTAVTLGAGRFILTGRMRGYDPSYSALESALGYEPFTEGQALSVLIPLAGSEGIARQQLTNLFKAGGIRADIAASMQTKPISKSLNEDIFGTKLL